MEAKDATRHKMDFMVEVWLRQVLQASNAEEIFDTVGMTEVVV
jgi:hypothetical protein